MTGMFDLHGRTAVVTGCRRGIGFAMAEALAAAGADVIGISAQQESSGSAIEVAVRSHGREFEAIACDFSEREAVHGFPEKIFTEAGPVTVFDPGFPVQWHVES